MITFRESKLISLVFGILRFSWHSRNKYIYIYMYFFPLNGGGSPIFFWNFLAIRSESVFTAGKLRYQSNDYLQMLSMR